MNAEFPTIHDITKLCFDKFQALPKTGKPTAKQWTVLAAIVQYNKLSKDAQVVALGCGTKCIGYSKLCRKGLILNDSHAEVLARRAFVRYLHHELRKAADQQTQSIFNWNAELCCYVINENLSFHFLSTQTPCGDACIVAESKTDSDVTPAKRQCLDNNNDNPGNLLSTAVYTGAKLIIKDNNVSDDMQQTPAALRTKPGRGERTLSMSCSDKLSRWNILGIQGALIDAVIARPIYLSSLNFCCVNARFDCIQRAVYKRWLKSTFEHARFQPQKPAIRIDTTIQFEYRQQEDWQPAPNGLIWSEVPVELRQYEISVNGKRQGVTKKKLETPQAALEISKYKILAAFVELLRCCPELCEKFKLQLDQLDDLTYVSAKCLGKEYQEAWQLIQRTYFRQWTHKSKDLLSFSMRQQSHS